MDFVLAFSIDQKSDEMNRWANSSLYKLRGLFANNFAYSLNIELVGVHGDSPYRDNDPILKGRSLYFSSSVRKFSGSTVKSFPGSITTTSALVSYHDV